MSHLDDETLALLAMGERIDSDADLQHLAECRACAAEVNELSHAALVARSSIVDGSLETPPGAVWSRIHGELGLDAALAADPLTASPEPSVLPSLRPEPAAEAAHAAEAAPGRATMRARRSLRTLWVLAASAALVVALGTGVWVVRTLSTPAAVVASAELDAFPDHPQSAGEAEVADEGDGVRTLTVTLEGDEQKAGDYREVWLIRNDGEALISLGVLEDASGSFLVPEGVDLGQYNLVDISFEPLDGDPGHSGDSIVRGELDFI